MAEPNFKPAKSNNDVAREMGFGVAILVACLVIFPMLVAAIPFYIVSRIVKKPRVHLGLAVVGVFTVVLGMLTAPEAYLGLYGVLPIDLAWLGEALNTPMVLNQSSYILYVSGGMAVSYGLYLYTEFVRSRKISSKEDARDKFLASNQYKKIYKKRFELASQVQKRWRKKGKFDEVLIGIKDNGKPYYLDFKEINQHHFVSATTGGGKTIYLLIYVEHAMANNYPMIFIDGKGSLETIEEVSTVCNAYNRELKVFSDTRNLTYNPLRYGNATIITDKLKELVETESVYYSEISTSLVQALILFIDDYGFKRDLQTFAKFLDPEEIKKVLNNDTEEVEVNVVSDSDSEDYKSFLDDDSKETFNPLDELDEEPFNDNEDDGFSSFLDEPSSNEKEQEEEREKEPAVRTAETPVKTRKEQQMTARGKTHHDRIFKRWESSDEGELYLFANASSVRTQIYLLLDSELGHLFEDKEDGLDLVKMSDDKEAVFVSFDGLIYDDYIKKIARFLILDLNYLVSKRNKNKEKDNPILAIYDEFSVYANPKIVDTVNKSRSAGFHCCIATQTLADLDDVSETLGDRILGNTNTYAIGQTNLPEEVEQWSNTLGTFKDVDMTTTTEAKGSMNRQERMLEAGTVRKVNKFKVSPDTIKSIRAGQFLLARKASKADVEPEIVYVRNPLIGLGKE